MNTTRTPMEIMLDRIAWEEVPEPADDSDGIPYATHKGVLRLGDVELRCYVLSNGKRVFNGDDIERLFAPPQDQP